ncbi:hypothetical protein GCM10009122_17350 [Fulvivirga kasyanovii]|uniref:(2Fe-2S) ferredoxin domain-containing protein n=1 Tax=Fulvivirga kasyanovii TaxID=396812 RepID=A0ABW9RTW8_9BACT|nr:(2Fe-2S) ferredoxin domain-containing protein [Fulvivirga kasyanovii]MTI26495.1 (2Fe-2S) ferredoxin domain-containing protein [Fulvivirga kasyanovii]
MGKDLGKTSHCILFCNGGSCKRKGAEEITSEIRAYMKSEGLYNQVHTVKTMCNGRCEDAPTLIVMPENTWYKNLTVEKGIELVEQHIKLGKPVNKNILYAPGMSQVASDNPLAPPEAKFFEEVNDPGLGPVSMAQADPWEQNLYPMLKDIFQKYRDDVELVVPQVSPKTVSIPSTIQLSYDHKWFTAKAAQWQIQLAIGIPSKDDGLPYKKRRIGTAEAFRSMDQNQYGVRFKSKDGETQLLVFDNSNEKLFWSHFCRIYLEINEPDMVAVSSI